jgi:hypothetical protein
MALLDYLLGGAAGGFEGYERRKAKDIQAQKDEEDRQIKQLAMLNQLGFRATGPVRETPDEAARNIVGDISAEVPKPAFDTTMGRAFGAAQKRGFGVAEQPTSPLTSPVSLALDSSKISQFERAKGMQPASPETRATIKGIGTLGFRPPETEEEKSQREYNAFMRLEQGKRSLSAQDARLKAEADAAASKAKVDFLVASGIEPQRAARIVALEAKYADVEETPSVAATKRGQDISAATARRGQDLADKRKDAEGVNEIQSGLQAMGVARASSSLNLLETNTKLMDRFEKDVLDGKAQITALQLEAARFALSGGKGSAVAEDRLAKGIPGVMPPNPALLRYVRAGKGISGAVREITPRGGSNLMMQMEQTLAGIGPAGTDAESIGQVQTFRNDILAGVREGVNAMRGKPQPATGGAMPSAAEALRRLRKAPTTGGK